MRTYGDADERGGDFAAVFAKKVSGEVDKLIELIMTASSSVPQVYVSSQFGYFCPSKASKLSWSSSVPQVYVCS